MGSNMKLAAEKLFKIADALEKEAADNTYFVCDGCNHTSSLADINAKRVTAGMALNVKRIASVSVNDKVLCPACGDKMAYVPTDMSEKYYVEAESEDVGADIFEPVDERDNEGAPEADVPEGDEPPAVDEAAPVEDEAEPAVDEPETDESAPKDTEDDMSETSDIPDYDGTSDNETPTDETEEPKADDSFGTDEAVPEATDTEGETSQEEVPSEGEDNPVTEETVPEDSADEMTTDDESISDETETPEDESDSENGVVLPKKDVPKFEKIPKDASDDFLRAVAKYSI